MPKKPSRPAYRGPGSFVAYLFALTNSHMLLGGQPQVYSSRYALWSDAYDMLAQGIEVNGGPEQVGGTVECRPTQPPELFPHCPGVTQATGAVCPICRSSLQPADAWKYRHQLKRGLWVRLEAPGNPDFQQYAPIGPSTFVPVTNLQEAVTRCRQYIAVYGLGGGNWGLQAGCVFREGKALCRISYNGRLWDLHDQPFVETDHA